MLQFAKSHLSSAVTKIAKLFAMTLVLMSFMTGNQALAEAKQAAPQNIPALLKAYGKTWVDRDVEAIVALHSEDTVFRIMVNGVEPARGKEELRQLLTAIFTANPNYSSTHKSLFVGKDYVLFEYDMHIEANLVPKVGPHTFKASDKAYSIPAIDLIIFENGLVKEKVTYLDVETVRANQPK